MTKIKTFRFIGSQNKYQNETHYCIKESNSEIDTVLNEFIEDNVKELIDIKITTVDCKYHNNAGYNNVDLIYTIIYK